MWGSHFKTQPIRTAFVSHTSIFCKHMLISGNLGPGGGESVWPCQDKWVSANDLERTIVLLWMALTGQMCYEWPWQVECIVMNRLDSTNVLWMALTGRVYCHEWPWQDKCVLMNGLDRSSVLSWMDLRGQMCSYEWPWQDKRVAANGFDRTILLLRMALTGQMCCYEWPWQDKQVAANGFRRTVVLLWMVLTGQVNSCYNTCCKSQLCHTLMMEPSGFCGWKWKLVSSPAMIHSKIVRRDNFLFLSFSSLFMI